MLSSPEVATILIGGQRPPNGGGQLETIHGARHLDIGEHDISKVHERKCAQFSVGKELIPSNFCAVHLSGSPASEQSAHHAADQATGTATATTVTVSTGRMVVIGLVLGARVRC
jgi:hypothetical protein